jgi:hypothetical protein
MPGIIQNCFAKCGFNSPSSVNADDNKENCKWVNCKATLVAPVLQANFLMLTELSIPLLIS